MPTNPLEADPTGVAGAIVTVGTALGLLGIATFDEAKLKAIAGSAVIVVNAVTIIVARVKAWSPNSVRALTPGTVGAEGVLPDAPI